MKKHIPNMITCCNLICGCIAVVFALEGSPRWSLLMIIAGAVFDFFDGMTARLLNVSSPIGKELDSLADDITFGVAPAAIVYWELAVIDYPAFLESWRVAIPYVAFLIAAFSALRLAKFNLDERQATSFIGLPTPANALFWGSLVASSASRLEGLGVLGFWMLIALVLLSCVLLVSELPMFALKFKHWGWKGNEVKYAFAVVSLLVLAVTGLLRGFWIVILLYIFLSFALHVTRKTSND